MADVISRLKLDSGEFDSKIKRAGQELMAYSEHCKETGSTMGEANKDAKDFAKALGSMQTTSSSARGKINELTEAFVNLKVMYKNMTDEEKNNAFGKNLAASLDQLKTRIDQAKTELNDVNKELGNTKQAEVDTKGGLEGLTSALGINMKSLAGWGAAIAAGKVALDVAKDAFFASESTVDEWGRTVAASQSLYEGFLTAINNGDISGYLSNIDSIVKAARQAYDELDKLGTMKTIQAPQISKQQTENERIRSMIQTGRYIAPQDGRRNAVFNGREMQTGDKLTAGQIRYLEKQLQGGMQKVVKLVGNEVDQTGKAINAYYNKLAKTNGMSLQEFKKGTSSWEEFSKRMQGYDQYKEWDKQARTEFAKQGGRGYVNFDKSNPFAEFRKWGTFRVDKEGDNSYKDLVALIQQRDQQVGQMYSTQAQAYRTMNRAEGFTVSKLMGNGGTGNKNKKEYDDLQKVQQEIAKLTKEAYTADESRVEEIKAEIAGLQEEEKRLTKIRDLVTGKNTTVEVVTGLSGFNEQTISAWTSMMKSEISKADLGSDLYNSLVQNVSDMNTLTTAVQDAMKLGLKIPQADVQEMFEAIFDRGTLPEDLYAGMIQKFIDEFKERTGKDLQVGENGSLSTGTDKGKDKKQDNTVKQLEKLNSDFSKMTGGVSSIVSGIQQMGVEIPKEIQNVFGVLSGISSIMTGITSILSLILVAEQVTATTSAVKSIPIVGWALANGGIIHAAGGYRVPGNNFSGDMVPAMLNSGELVLNKAQQGNLASQLDGGLMQNLKIDWVLRSDKLYAVMNNRGRRTGKGELVQRNRI